VKPAKVSVYLKVSSVSVPARIEGVQFGFGQTCGAENALADCAGTRNCPFLVEATVAEVLSEAQRFPRPSGAAGERPLLGTSSMAAEDERGSGLPAMVVSSNEGEVSPRRPLASSASAPLLGARQSGPTEREPPGRLPPVCFCGSGHGSMVPKLKLRISTPAGCWMCSTTLV
jgi:hypothetical protein